MLVTRPQPPKDNSKPVKVVVRSREELVLAGSAVYRGEPLATPPIMHRVVLTRTVRRHEFPDGDHVTSDCAVPFDTCSWDLVPVPVAVCMQDSEPRERITYGGHSACLGRWEA